MIKHKEYNQYIYDTQYNDAVATFPTKRENPYQYELKEIKIQLLREYCHGKRVLDMGCGPGKYSFIAAQLAEEVVGVDFSENMLSYFRDKLKQRDIKNINILHENIKSLPEEIKSEYFDVVFSYAVLYHVDKVEEVLKEMHRVLRPGGYAIFDMGNLWSINTLICRHTPTGVKSYHLSPRKMKKLVMDIGFRIERLRHFQLFPMYGGNIIGFKGEYYLTRFITMRGKFELRLFSKKINGKMLDEVISSLFPFKYFAFRYLFVCQKEA